MKELQLRKFNKQQRSLSGIRNKLLLQDISGEVQVLVIDWLTKLYQQDRTKIKDSNVFFKGFLDIIKGANSLRGTSCTGTSLDENAGDNLSPVHELANSFDEEVENDDE